MEFGKADNVDNINWELPADDSASLSYLTQLNNNSSHWFLGTPTWGSSSWVGKIYPREASKKEFLHYYSRAFNTIELNTTHYRIPSAVQVSDWVGEVPRNFKFCPKFPQDISHRVNGLKDKETLLLWQQSLEQFGDNLGVSWIQLPPYFDYSQKAQLHQFLEAWPAELPLALELRHPTWFHKGSVLPALAEYLRRKNIGLVITDVAGKREVLHSTITAPFVLVRFIGNELHESDFTRVGQWSERLQVWCRQGLEQVYFFAHEPDDITCPELVDYVVKRFNQSVGSNWIDPWHQTRSALKLI